MLPWLDEYAGQSTDELLALEGRYRTDSIIGAFHQALGQKSDRIGDENLTTPERVVNTVATMEGAVNMDGFLLGLFTNNPEVVADIVPSLRAIGDDWVADLTESAIAVLGLGRPLSSESVRAAAKAADPEAEERLGELDQTHFARGIDLAELLLRYIKANRDQITLP